jgi:predicted nucleic acid-binding protein
MIAIDTNLLVYAHRAATPEHRAARKAIEAACNSLGGCGIALPSIAEFFSIVTHATASGRPSTPQSAAEFLTALEEGGVVVLQPGPSFAVRLIQTAADLGVNGVRIFDLQVGLCALDGGATELWTHDGKFTKLPGLLVKDPIAPK